MTAAQRRAGEASAGLGGWGRGAVLPGRGPSAARERGTHRAQACSAAASGVSVGQAPQTQEALPGARVDTPAVLPRPPPVAPAPCRVPCHRRPAGRGPAAQRSREQTPRVLRSSWAGRPRLSPAGLHLRRGQGPKGTASPGLAMCPEPGQALPNRAGESRARRFQGDGRRRSAPPRVSAPPAPSASRTTSLRGASLCSTSTLRPDSDGDLASASAT